MSKPTEVEMLNYLIRQVEDDKKRAIMGSHSDMQEAALSFLKWYKSFVVEIEEEEK